MPNPENRVLFELTTISNELGRENMTTVQTSLIPQSNRSNKQGNRVRGSSERPLLFKTYEPERPTQPFVVSSAESLQQAATLEEQRARDRSDQSRQSAANLNAAYREVVMNQARKQSAMVNDQSRDSS